MFVVVPFRFPFASGAPSPLRMVLEDWAWVNPRESFFANGLLGFSGHDIRKHESLRLGRHDWQVFILSKAK